MKRLLLMFILSPFIILAFGGMSFMYGYWHELHPKSWSVFFFGLYILLWAWVIILSAGAYYLEASSKVDKVEG